MIADNQRDQFQVHPKIVVDDSMSETDEGGPWNFGDQSLLFGSEPRGCFIDNRQLWRQGALQKGNLAKVIEGAPVEVGVNSLGGSKDMSYPALSRRLDDAGLGMDFLRPLGQYPLFSGQVHTPVEQLSEFSSQGEVG